MTDRTTLQEALLELGLEDWIALPDVRSTPEIRDLDEDDQTIENVSVALTYLLREGRVQVWSGRWPEEPKPVGIDRAEAMLQDERSYSFDAGAGGIERVYFTNVANFRA